MDTTQKMTTIENERLDKMEQQLDDLEIKVDKILNALTGDKLQMDKGLIPELKEMRDRVSKLEALKNKIIWVSIGAGLAVGISLNKIIEWIQASAQVK